MAGTGQAHSRGNESTGADMNRRGIQDHTVIVDDCKAVGMDIESVVTVKRGFNKGQRMASTQQLVQDLLPPPGLIGRRLVVLPAQPLGLGLPLLRDIPVLPHIPLRALENFQWFHIGRFLPYFADSAAVSQSDSPGIAAVHVFLCKTAAAQGLTPLVLR